MDLMDEYNKALLSTGDTGASVGMADLTSGMGAVEPPPPEPDYGAMQTPIQMPKQQYTAGGAMSNVPESAGKYWDDVTYMFREPKNFMKGVAMLFQGEGLNALKDHYVERYGGVDNAARTAYEDPVGFMSDVSMLGLPLRVAGFGSKLAKEGGAVSKTLGAAGELGKTVDAIDPINIAAKAAPALAAQTPGIRTFPERNVGNQLKASTTPNSKFSRPEVRSRVANTLLDNDIAIDYRGMDKLQGMVDQKMVGLDNLINAADEAGTKIPVRHVMNNLMSLYREVGDPLTNPKAHAHRKAVAKYMRDWLKDLGPVREFTPSQLRVLRQNLDKQINWTSKPTVEQSIKTTITEQAAHGARNALSETIDDLGPQNKGVARLLEAKEPLHRAAARMDNNNTIPLRGAMGATAGATGAIVGDTMMEKLASAILGGASVAWTPGVQNKAARYIYKMRDKLPEQLSRRLLTTLLADAQKGSGIAMEQQPYE